MQSVVKFLFSSLQNSPFGVLKDFDDYGKFYCVDVRDTNKPGGGRTYKALEPIDGEMGILVIFNKGTKEVLYIGKSTNLNDYVQRLINGNNTTSIKDMDLSTLHSRDSTLGIT